MPRHFLQNLTHTTVKDLAIVHPLAQQIRAPSKVGIQIHARAVRRRTDQIRHVALFIAHYSIIPRLMAFIAASVLLEVSNFFFAFFTWKLTVL